MINFYEIANNFERNLGEELFPMIRTTYKGIQKFLAERSQVKSAQNQPATPAEAETNAESESVQANSTGSSSARTGRGTVASAIWLRLDGQECRGKKFC